MATTELAPSLVRPGAPSPEDIEKLKGQFLASLNQELRLPVSGLLEMLAVLLETPLNEEQREFAETAKTCANQALEALNSVLSYSSLATGEVQPVSSEFSWRQVLQMVAWEIQPKIQAKGLTMRLEFEPSLPETIVGDGGRFRDVVAQLMSNAVKFTERGDVRIRARINRGQGAPRLEFEFRDTGIGMTPEQLAQLFHSFHQLDRGLARSYTGLGLGLAIAEKTARLLGGHIEAASRLGAGSTFTFSLPLREAAHAVAAEPAWAGAGESAPAPEPKAAALVIDDDPVARKVMRHLLSSKGYDADTAASGEEGVALAGRRAYDVILTDMQLPGLSGMETAAALRRLPGGARLVIVGLTATPPDAGQQDNCVNRGLDGCVGKGTPHERLLSGIQALVAARAESQARASA